jgi:aspartyl-tRNA(Asn)/glutamyl-tRNA(Gln) amidotransferase subunit B
MPADSARCLIPGPWKDCENILADHPSDVADYRAGNLKVMGFFMGQAMKAAKGKANPKIIKVILTARLSE